MRLSRIAIMSVACFAVAVSAGFAQTAPPQPVSRGSAAAQPLNCADFTRNADGSWSPRRMVSMKGFTISPGVSFTEGVTINGIDLAKQLNSQCAH